MINGNIRKQWRRYSLLTTTGHWQALLTSRTPIHERSQQRKVIGQIFQDSLEVSFEAGHSRPCFSIAPLAPLGKLPRNDFLNGLSIGEVRRAARTAPDEIVLAQGETGGQVRMVFSR
jgi:hypothetical protein